MPAGDTTIIGGAASLTIDQSIGRTVTVDGAPGSVMTARSAAPGRTALRADRERAADL